MTLCGSRCISPTNQSDHRENLLLLAFSIGTSLITAAGRGRHATIATEIAGVMTAAGSTGEAAAVVLSTASDLSSRSTELSGEVDQFLATVRAA